MRIIKEKQSGKVIAHGKYITLKSTGAVLKDCKAPNITTTTHELIEISSIPDDYKDNYYIYSDDGVWERTDSGNEAFIEKNISTAKSYRDEVADSPITVLNVLWDINQQSRDNMRTAIETADRNNLPDETTQGWILADDTIRDTTAAELGQVLDAYAYRLQDVFTQYAIWMAGDKINEFQYVE